MAFEAGDEVRLKSGGPPMTVESVAGAKVNCAWFVDREAKRDSFEEAMLKPFTRAAISSSSRSPGSRYF